MWTKRSVDPVTNPRWTRVADWIVVVLWLAAAISSWGLRPSLGLWLSPSLVLAGVALSFATTIERRRLRAKFGDP